MKAAWLLVVLVLPAACVPPPPQPYAGHSARRVHRPVAARTAQQPILRPVLSHTSDSIATAFPALDPRVVVGAGSEDGPDRVRRLALPEIGQAPGRLTAARDAEPARDAGE